MTRRPIQLNRPEVAETVEELHRQEPPGGSAPLRAGQPLMLYEISKLTGLLTWPSSVCAEPH